MEINGSLIYPSFSSRVTGPGSPLAAKPEGTNAAPTAAAGENPSRNIINAILAPPAAENSPNNIITALLDAAKKTSLEGGEGSKNQVSASAALKRMDMERCETCASRRYQDASNDPGVSMQMPTKIAPGSAPMMVGAHEQEHVSRDQRKAQNEGRKVVFQAVRIFTDVCPECQKVYVSGGVTETVTAAAENKNPFNLGGTSGIGGYVNTAV